MSGAPGSGKSTLAEPLAAELGYALLGKDIIKETLHAVLGPPDLDRARSRELGAASMELLWALAARSPQVLIEANFRPYSDYERDRLTALGGVQVEVHCTCAAELAVARYNARPRHLVHVQTNITPDYLAEFDRPVGIGALVTVDTTAPVDVPAIAAQIRSLLLSPGPIAGGLRISRSAFRAPPFALRASCCYLAETAGTGARIHRMGAGGPDGPDAGDGVGGFGGLHWDQAPQADASGFPGGRRGARILAVADAAAIAVPAARLIAAPWNLVKPHGGAVWAGTPRPGFVTLIAAIVVMRARRPSRTGRRFSSDPGRRRSISGDLRLSFGPLDRRVTGAVGALCVIGFLSFVTGIIFTFHGGPAGSGGGCAYRLQGHGIYTCVSKTAYDLAGAAQQRMVAGICLFFYAIHFYAALASGTALAGPD